MLRDKLASHHKPVDGFRWRSHEIMRVEGFSDAVFGFALTLLIVSLEVPHTSTELLATMRGFGAFVVTFVMLSGIWYAQYSFFRRYGLEDRFTVVLNLALLFTVLFFVYPLKFLFSVMLGDPTLRHARVETAHGLEFAILPQHRPLIFAIFGAGMAAVFLVFILLYRHAYKKRFDLGLNEFEIFETRHAIRRMTVSVIVALSYFALAWMQSLPRQTAAEQHKVEIVSIVITLGFAVLVFWLVKLQRERRRVRKEWLSQVPAPADEHAEWSPQHAAPEEHEDWLAEAPPAADRGE